jgi:hypothetical protein
MPQVAELLAHLLPEPVSEQPLVELAVVLAR